MTVPKARTRKTQQTVKGGLRGFVEARKTNIGILSDIRTHVVARGNENANVGREAHKIHVSELVKDDRCIRRMFYKITEVEPTDAPRAAFHRLEMIWAAGHAEHAKWQRWLREMGVLYGTWRCMLCQHEWQETSPQHCPNCGEGEEFLTYLEVELEDPFYPLVGHADGAVPERRCLIEVKSFSVGTVRIEAPELVRKHTHHVDDTTIVDIDAIWKSIKRPLKSHLNQGLMYLLMCKRMGLPYDTIVYIYENKANQDTKAFEVKLTERLVQEFIDILEEVDIFVTEGVVPLRPEGFTKDSRPCNECQFKSHCFGSDEENGDDSSKITRVQTRRSSAGGRKAGRASAVRSAPAPEGEDPGRTGRHHRTQRQRPDGPDDGDDPVGRAPRRATRTGRGGRAELRDRDGEGEGPSLSRSRQGRHRT